MCGSVGRFGLTTGATSSAKVFGEPWLRRTVASRSFGSDGCMLIEKTVKVVSYSSKSGLRGCGGLVIRLDCLRSSRKEVWPTD